MARKKSPLMRRLNMRWFRWCVMRALAACAPALGRKLSFPTSATTPDSCALEVMEDAVYVEAFAPTPDEVSTILVPAMANDTGDSSGNPRGECVFHSQAIVLRGCSVAGHTRAVLRDCDSSLVHLKGAVQSVNLAQPALLRDRPLSGRALVLSGARHYYHFLANDVLPLISYVQRFHDPAAPLRVVAHSDQTPAQREVFSALQGAWPFLDVLTLDRRERLRGADLLWVMRLGVNHEWMPVDRALADELAAILRAHYALEDDPAGARRLWFSRGDAPLRRLADEAQVEGALQERGFSRFVAHAANHKDQFAAFRSADVVVGVHGAGLANLLFCRPGTLVVEVFPENFVKSTYLWLARRLGLEYAAHVGGPGDYSQRFSAGAAGLERKLDLELGSRCVAPPMPVR
ncbi:MAG: Capsular polysaccharide biosynthesis protein-like protein [Hyphomicrobiales bacterium]|nr:Capsular polysaccharide biosynthesis protein-like protein [Hyphomicrobiales bacterium]